MYAQHDSTILPNPLIFTWRGATVKRFPAHDAYCYLIHFDTPYHHARHYLGSAADLDARLERHKAGNGARLMEVVTQAGISWQLARLWRFDTEMEARKLEHQLKKRHGSVGLCPICQHRAVDLLVAMRQGHYPLDLFARRGLRRPMSRQPAPRFVRRGDVALDCAWCLKERGEAPGDGSHGICARHAEEVRTAWLAKKREKRAAVVV